MLKFALVLNQRPVCCRSDTTTRQLGGNLAAMLALSTLSVAEAGLLIYS